MMSKMTGGAERIQKELMREWAFADVDETCRELHRAGYLNCFYAGDVTYASSLEDSAIIFMENRFANGIAEILDYMVKIKAAIFR